MEAAAKSAGRRIRQARHDAGLTQAALAVAAGTRERNIIRWENDQHSPRFEHLAAIARATGKDISFFVAEAASDDDEEPDSQVMLRAAYHLDRAGEFVLADDLRLRARKAKFSAIRRETSESEVAGRSSSLAREQA
jgi:transcriptional regulator with XRE-family HTH domain